MSTLTQFYGASAANLIPVELLIVGGGGAGASVVSKTTSSSGEGRFGGGSGRLIFSSTTVSKGLAYTITIGGGGAASTTTTGAPGIGNSSFFGLIEAAGGIGAAQLGNQNPFQPQRSTLCGSMGGQYNTTGTTGVPATVHAATPPPVFMQINSADNFYYSLAGLGGFAVITNPSGSAGGGGAGGWGSGLVNTGILPGGSGFAVSIVGSSVFYASGGVGRAGGGNVSGVAGTDNTGNGGGGASIAAFPLIDYLGGNGGSGVVIIAYRDTYPVPTSITGTYDQPTRTGYRVYRFTGSGSITF
jgi:hypothetical protein